MLKLPKIIGHRGAADYAPENTLQGIHTAADMGVEWVELDVKLTKDDVPILFHDDTLERTTNGSGNVKDFTLEELKELEAGHWFSDGFYGVNIPTLEEAVDVLLERDLGLNLEIKACPGRERETAEIALDVLAGIWDDHDKLLISSFSNVSLEAAQEMASDWHRGFLLPEEWPENWEEIAEYLQVSTVHFNGNLCSRDHVGLLQALQKPLLAYTINDPDRARLLQSWGVDGFFTDAPDVLQDGLLTVH
ncbi:glycerophosphodiester phosphodiesterase family protein [Alphaproteobacteria bacterium]|nr:glycerophosphodiester phosphodiesterase family protein [Alphaproteobacteria bacterium]